MFESRVLRKICRPERGEVTGGWRTPHNEEFHTLYFSPNIRIMIRSRRMIWVGHVTRMREMRNAYKILVGKPEVNIRLGRPKENMALGDVGLDSVDWIHLAQNREQSRLL
jgi:hypothetical protein